MVESVLKRIVIIILILALILLMSIMLVVPIVVSHVYGESANKSGGENGELKFITVGDPQIDLKTLDGVERLRQVVSFANKSDIDFVLFEGDMTDDGTIKSNDVIKNILKDLNKPYYVVVGNHDMYVSKKIFESYYGPTEHIENVKGYQLLFIGINDRKNEEGNVTKLNWSFDFSKADKNVPTLVFIHGPVVDIPTGCIYCRMQKDILAYGYSLRPELEKFSNLIGVYSGHVHYDSNRVVNNTRYVTVNGLVNVTVMGITIAHASNKVGYSVIQGNKSYYDLVSYV